MQKGKKINKLIVAPLIPISASLLCTASTSANTSFPPVNVEPLYAIRLTDTSATIVVMSTGCTRKEDFRPVLHRNEPPQVTFIRLKPDLCKAAPFAMEIEFSLEQVGSTNFQVTNTFSRTMPGFPPPRS